MGRTLRDIIKIDLDLCDGCGDCIGSCEEGALEVVDGKVRLKGEILCDGAGACIGSCPTGALTIENRESDEYDQAAVEVNLKQMAAGSPTVLPTMDPAPMPHGGGGCPGSAMRQFGGKPQSATVAAAPGQAGPSRLTQWPVQLMLVPPTAPYFKNADLLVAADCVPFAFPDFHEQFLSGKGLVVGCPKLDDLQHYFEKLTEIIRINDLKSIEVLKMEVPCCGGIAQAVVEARKQAGVDVPVTITTIGVEGGILESAQV